MVACRERRSAEHSENEYIFAATMISAFRVFAASTLLAVPVAAQSASLPYSVVKPITIRRFMNPAAIPARQGRRAAIPVEDMLRTRAIGEYSEPSFSHDGRWLAYVVRDNQQTRIGADVGPRSLGGVGGDVVVLNVESGEVQNLTHGKGDNWGAVWSPNGQMLAFFSDRDGGDSARIWMWDRRTGRLREVARITVWLAGMQWTPDSKQILVTGPPRRIKGEQSVAIAGAQDTDGVRDRARTASPTVARYSFSPEHGGAGPASTSDPWSLDAYTGSLMLIGVDHGIVRSLIDRQRISAFALSRDGLHVAYTSPVRFERPGSQQVLWDLKSIDLASGDDVVVAHDIRLVGRGGAFSWSPDGEALAYQVGGMEERANDCYVVTLRDKQPQKLALASPHSDTGRETRALEAPLWHGPHEMVFLRRGTLWRGAVNHGTATQIATVADRKIVQLVARRPNELWADPADSGATVVLTSDPAGKQDGFYRIDLATGRSTPLLERGQCYSCASQIQSVVASPDGRQLLYFAEDASHPNDLWLTDAAFRTPRRLTQLNPQFDHVALGSARLIDWLGLDGDTLHGALLLPSEYRAGTRYPLIVYVYGGAYLSNRFDGFGLAGRGPFNMQMFATRGYAVLLPDAPQHAGTPMVDLAKTILPGVNKVIEMGIADPARLGVMGHSYGGYTTLSLIVQTPRFKAAVAVDGLGDLLSTYGQMDSSGAAFGTSIAEAGQGLLRGTPWQVRDRYIENSPIVYLDRVETPVLLIHGAADQTVAPFLSDEVFVGLRRLGKEVEYLKYRGEDHVPSSWGYANQVDYCRRLVAWFDDHLKP